MGIGDLLAAEAEAILRTAWDIRDARVVPENEEVALSGGGARLAATVLYADLAASTDLATSLEDRAAAKIFKLFLAMSTRVIRHNGGEIRSFDGDRVMGVFVGDHKNSTAARCALQVNWGFLNIVRPRVEAHYPRVQEKGLKLAHCAGIDSGTVLAVRTGIRRNNDLIWVGRAPNIAAKLSGIRDSPYHTFITGAVYDSLAKEVKISGDGRAMWEERVWKAMPSASRVYRSHWSWGF